MKYKIVVPILAMCLVSGMLVGCGGNKDDVQEPVIEESVTEATTEETEEATKATTDETEEVTNGVNEESTEENVTKESDSEDEVNVTTTIDTAEDGDTASGEITVEEE